MLLESNNSFKEVWCLGFMVNFNLAANGPSFSLNMVDVENLRKSRFLDIVEDNLVARISLVEHDPNKIKFPNGGISLRDISGYKGFRLKRYPENICPYTYKGKQYYILRIQKTAFEDLVKMGKNSDGIGFIHPRCDRYDRFALCIFTNE